MAEHAKDKDFPVPVGLSSMNTGQVDFVLVVALLALVGTIAAAARVVVVGVVVGDDGDDCRRSCINSKDCKKVLIKSRCCGYKVG